MKLKSSIMIQLTFDLEKIKDIYNSFSKIRYIRLSFI